MKYLSLLVLSSVLTVACSTKQATVTNKVLPSLYAKKETNTVPLTIIRDQGIVGAACKTKVFINEQQVAALSPSESVTLYVPSGDHILSVDTKAKLCPSVKDAKRINLERNKPISYRISFDSNGNMQLLPIL